MARSFIHIDEYALWIVYIDSLAYGIEKIAVALLALAYGGLGLDATRYIVHHAEHTRAVSSAVVAEETAIVKIAVLAAFHSEAVAHIVGMKVLTRGIQLQHNRGSVLDVYAARPLVYCIHLARRVAQHFLQVVAPDNGAGVDLVVIYNKTGR